MKYVAAILLALGLCFHAAFASASPQTLQCTSVTDVTRMHDMLYKNENVHGGRGRSLLDQGHHLKGVKRLLVAGKNFTVFACFGLYRCDLPYGCRYYQAMCHDTLSNKKFLADARLNGGKDALVGTAKAGPCFEINASSSRDGSVRKPH